MPDDAFPVDDRLDLVLERVLPIARRLVWLGWTRPEHVVRWFTPPPWTTVACDIDLRPGGIFRTVMRSPEGEEFGDGAGCYLIVEPERRLAWTDALGPAFRPAARARPDALPLTAVLTFDDVPGGTRYRAHVMHASADDRQRHLDMGFFEGWGTATDQLVAAMADAG